jgi:hypothetical protein
MHRHVFDGQVRRRLSLKPGLSVRPQPGRSHPACARLRRGLQGPQHNHLHLHAEVPSREEAIEAAVECLQVFAPHLLAAAPVVPIDLS